jgi:hypothetical protein
MITFNNIGYMGRFGNQMFQFASTVGIAEKLGFDSYFPRERFVSTSPDSYDGCKLMECFDIPEVFLVDSSKMDIKYMYIENDFKYNPETERLPDSTTLDGYYQTEKYFSHIDDLIREIFTFRESVKEESKKFATIENGVSVHVRRGDYLGSPNHHPTQSIEYYNEGISEFGECKNFYIFSDDPEWCKQNIKIKNSQVIESGNPYVDMYLMSQCKGHVIANSSFSWWGAWLSGNESKVVAPKNWFGPAMGKDTSDIYCKNWIIK